MDVCELDRWVSLLRSVAEPGVGTVKAAMAPWFLAHRGRAEQPTAFPHHLDEILWRALCTGDLPPAPTLAAINPDGANDPAPLSVFTEQDTIEVWTERELSSLHALERLAQRERRRDWLSRVDLALAWHLEFTEPDNATGRPWAIQVFAIRWIEQGDAEARLYAQMLLHNCRTLEARPDPLSAEILLDAADALEAMKKA